MAMDTDGARAAQEREAWYKAEIARLSDELALYKERSERGSEIIFDRLKAAELQLSEAKKLLVKVEEQGLAHQCAMEGYTGPDCDDCMAGLEQDILKFLGATVEKLPTEKPKSEAFVMPLCDVQVGCFGQCGKLLPCEDHAEKRICDHKIAPTFDGLGVRYKCQLCNEYVSE